MVSSLRGRLGAAATLGLLTSALLSGLLLYTAWTARDVVRTARLMHDRVQVYTLLLETARAYQNASYRKVREPTVRNAWDLLQHRQRLVDVLDQALSLQPVDPHDRQVAPVIRQQVEAVIDHYRHAELLVRSVDSQWQEGGSRAALAEVNRVSAPIFALEDLLQSEIRLGGVKVAAATRSAHDLTSLAATASIIALLIAVIFFLAFHALLHLRLRPGLQRLEDGAQAFAAGKLAHRINLPGHDELTKISSAFDTMAATIAEKQAALHEIQIGLERAVATRTAELQSANAELFAADERRRTFLADVGHQLRTPLTVIRGETQIALRTADSPGFDPHETFERIDQLSLDLSRMVDDLFLIARAEAGGLPLDLSVTDLRQIAARVSSDFETLVTEWGGTITVDSQEEILASVDQDRLRRALAALIENALRHCQPGVNIMIEVGRQNGFASLAVEDDGPGVDPAQVTELFQRFSRGPSRSEGSGLGLNLVSALVEAHGGSVTLARQPYGGTRATIFLPLIVHGKAAA